MTQARFGIEREGSGWRVVDSRTGHFHSARIAQKDRAQRQADALNVKMAEIERARREAR